MTVTSALTQEKCRNRFLIEQNGPNPFKKKTTIKINLPYRTKITVIITNAYGKVVDKMISSIHNAGSYDLEFCAEELPRGTYFCHVVADDFCDSKEMELTK